jgi:peroxiredoxin
MGRFLIRLGCLVLFCFVFSLGFDARDSSEIVVDVAAAVDGQPNKKAVDLIARAKELFREGKYEQALTLVDEAIKDAGESVELLEFKDDLLWKLNRPEDRIKNVLRLEEIAERKSPWYCLKIAEADLQLGRIDEAFHWLEIAVDERGFRRVDTFDLDVYDSIRKDPRFEAIVAKARDNMGIGRPVPDFRIELLDGSELTLSSLKGTVTLVDFWASWCIPCRKETPNLKKIYDKFHRRGFEIVGISLDSDKNNALAYIEKNDLRWPESWLEHGYLDEPAKQYMVNSLPSMWLIDRNGILRYFNLKGNDLRKGVEMLLSEKAD